MKLIQSLIVAVCLLSAGLMYAGEENNSQTNYVVVPFSVTIFPIWGTGMKTIDDAQINIGAGYCDMLEGLSMGFVNIVGEDAVGLDCSLVGITGHNFNGVQCSLVTYTGNDFSGGQFSLVNIVSGNFSKAQSGLVNIVGGNFEGFQAGLMDIVAGDFKGFQAGLANVNLGNFNGFQAGLVNIMGDGFSGFQTGLANLDISSFNGPEIGLLNINMETSGFQFGLINFSKGLDGEAIGLISIVLSNGQTHGQIYVDENGFGNIALINGSRTIYNIYTVGIDQTGTYWTYGLGLGLHIPLDPFYINMEIIGSSVSHISAWDGNNTLGRFRVYAGFSIFEHLSMIAGLSLNYYRSWNGNPAYVSPFYNLTKTLANGDTLWPGIFAGVMF